MIRAAETPTEGIAMAARFLAPPPEARPWVILAALLMAGLLLVAVGVSAPEKVDFWDVKSTGWWLFYAGKLGELTLIGGFIGAVTRFMALAGIFRQSLIDAFNHPSFEASIARGTQHAITTKSSEEPFVRLMGDAMARACTSAEWLDRRSDLIDLWRILTRRIYLPFLRPGEPQEHTKLSELAIGFEESIREQFSYEQNHFLRDLERRLDVSWRDPEQEMICLDEIVTFELAPFDASQPIEWKVERTADSVLELADYGMELLELTVDGTPDPGNSVSVDGRTETTTYKLSGKDRYRVYRRRRIYWRLDLDPTLEHTSTYVTHGLTLHITNAASGINILFNEIGGSKLFEKLGAIDQIIKFGETSSRRAKKVLLPNQGYLLVCHRIKPHTD
jgi:hypothetical protein